MSRCRLCLSPGTQDRSLRARRTSGETLGARRGRGWPMLEQEQDFPRGWRAGALHAQSSVRVRRRRLALLWWSAVHVPSAQSCCAGPNSTAWQCAQAPRGRGCVCRWRGARFYFSCAPGRPRCLRPLLLGRACEIRADDARIIFGGPVIFFTPGCKKRPQSGVFTTRAIKSCNFKYVCIHYVIQGRIFHTPRF